MSGTIRRREVFFHTRLIVRLFGWKVWWRCMTSKRGETFLSIAIPFPVQHKGENNA